MALNRAGHRVIATANGVEAIEIAERNHEPIDLLIADVMMPGLSGPDVADRLRRRNPGMRTLFISGYSGNPVMPDRVMADSGAFLLKPFTPEVLLAKVQARLSRS
jgi:DNA-binding response OmpR family regulator